MSNISKIAEEIALVGPMIRRKIFNDTLLESITIPHSQLFVIMFLYHNGSNRFSDICKELKVAAPTATGIVNRLVKSGYVTRRIDKNDRRAVTVDLTDKGQKLSLQLRKAIVKRWTEILSQISEKDALKFLEITKKINKTL